MIVGILKEIKVAEKRVSMTPAGVISMISNGHEVLVEKAAGEGAGYPDAEYIAAGAAIVDTPAEIFQKIGYGHARQGTAAVRIRYDQRRPDSLHLSAPGRR